MSTDDTLKALREAIFDGEPREAVETLLQLKEKKVSAESILKDAVMPAINDIGESMAEGDFFMPEVKISTKALKEVAEELRSYSLEQLGLSSLDVLPWTGEGDIDDIGEFLQNIVVGSREKTAAELMSMLDMLASGLDTHEFTPCKIQGAEAKK